MANWGGLRGSIPIALAVGLPLTLAHRTELVSVVIGTVACSLFVQGLTFKPLIDRRRRDPFTQRPERRRAGVAMAGRTEVQPHPTSVDPQSSLLCRATSSSGGVEGRG